MVDDWERSEDRSAALYGRKTPGSGSLDIKLDIEGLGPYHGTRGENKFTSKESRSIKLAELRKAENQALQMGDYFFFILDFQLKHRYIMCSENYWIQIHEELAELRSKNEENKLYGPRK